MHRRIARALADADSRPPGADLAEHAYHAVAAIQGDPPPDATVLEADAREAATAARRAGDAAAASLAYEEAARLYRLAIGVAGLARGFNQRDVELLLAAGDAEVGAGDIDEGRSLFLQAASVAQRTGEPTLLARAALGFGGRHAWTRPGRLASGCGLLQDSLQAIGHADDRLRVRLLARLACAWRDASARRSDSDRLSAEALTLARTLDDPHAQLCACRKAVGYVVAREPRHTAAARARVAGGRGGNAKRGADCRCPSRPVPDP